MNATFESLLTGVNAVADRAALHEDDWMMPILSRDGRRKSQDEPCFRAPRRQLEARSGQVVTFINNQMAIICDKIRDFALLDKALDQCDVDDPGRLPAPAADDPDLLRINAQEGPQPLYPLI